MPLWKCGGGYHVLSIRSALLAKSDLSNTYRMIPVHPDDQPLLGVAWQGRVYMDRSMPFGLRSAAKIFNPYGTDVTYL